MIKIATQFQLDSAPVSCLRYGSGHINQTYLLITESGRRYILQRINQTVFRDVKCLMHNVASVTRFLAERDADPRHVLHLIPTLGGEDYCTDEAGECYRVYDFIEGGLSLDQAQNTEDFYQSAVAFGRFQKALAEFPAATLAETIPHFHDTPDRYRQLKEAIAKDAVGRVREAGPEIEFALLREEEAGTMMGMLHRGELPLRVTHNDTKLNNVMLDENTRTPLCVLDLDTVMPGLAGNDFGDSIRFGANTGAEDDPNLDHVSLSLELFDAYARGFLGECGHSLTALEKETLPLSAKLMTLECGTRFLTDYLSGDTYFQIHRPAHNMDRCRTQFKLVADMEKKWARMAALI